MAFKNLGGTAEDIAATLPALKWTVVHRGGAPAVALMLARRLDLLGCVTRVRPIGGDAANLEVHAIRGPGPGRR